MVKQDPLLVWAFGGEQKTLGKVYQTAIVCRVDLGSCQGISLSDVQAIKRIIEQN